MTGILDVATLHCVLHTPTLNLHILKTMAAYIWPMPMNRIPNHSHARGEICLVLLCVLPTNILTLKWHKTHTDKYTNKHTISLTNLLQKICNSKQVHINSSKYSVCYIIQHDLKFKNLKQYIYFLLLLQHTRICFNNRELSSPVR
jgi:hypothetical protein